MQAPNKPFVFAPGPVNLHPAVIEALSWPMIHHRTPEFDQILKDVLEKLKIVFATRQPCFALTSTGSGGMECLLVNTLDAGEMVLGIDSGKFGERWCEMAQTFGAHLVTMKIPWGKSVTPQAVEEHLQKFPQTKIVMCQACETSTGAKHPIQELGKIIAKYPDTLFLVDGITALGAYPLLMDEWQIDGLVGGSQKAFMLPTGMAFLSFSEKAWKKIKTNKQPKFYFDIRKELTANQKGETFFSSNVTLIRALGVVLDLILKQGLSAHYAEIQKRAAFTRQFALKLGCSLYAEHPSESVTALLVPAGLDSQKLRAQIETDYHFTIMGGQDQAKGKILRIGHMGHIQNENLISLMKSLAPVLKPSGLDLNSFENEMRAFLK